MIANFPILDEWFQEEAGFSHPDWPLIEKWIRETIPENSHNEAWLTIAEIWLNRVKDRLGDTFHLTQSQNFFLVSNFDTKRVRNTLQFLENTRVTIHKLLGEFAWNQYYGKHACIIFGDFDFYYNYASHFHKSEGERSGSSGMFIHGGYAHMIIADDAVRHLRPTLAHELTHNCMAHLPLPTWLNEAITESVEEGVTNVPNFKLNREIAEEHNEFWNAETIQEFWSGKSWSRPDNGNKLSYSLAKIILRIIYQDLKPTSEQFRNFLGDANYKDGGEASSQKHLGVGLGELAEVFLGEGDWAPKPQDS